MPVVLGETVLDREHRVGLDPLRPQVHHLGAAEGPAFALQLVRPTTAVLGRHPELAGCRVKGDGHLPPGLVPGLLDCANEEVHGIAVGLEVGRESALIALAGAEACFLNGGFEGVEDLGAGAEGFGKGRQAAGNDHEFLEVDIGVRVGTAIDDVQHRHRQGHRALAAEAGVEGLARCRGRGVGGGQGDAENGVGPEPALVGGAIEGQQGGVDAFLVCAIASHHHGGDLAIDVVDGATHSLAAVADRVAVPQLDRFVGPGGGAGGHLGDAASASVDGHLDLQGGVATRIQDLSGVD